jgi:hypothetical protein
MSEALDFVQLPADDDSHRWNAIERSLELATQAESLRELSRRLRETSRQIREEAARITREKLMNQIKIPQLD